MTGKVVYHVEVDGCDSCPGGLKEPHGRYRCKHDTEVVFQQNKDIGVPEKCPMR